MTHTPPRGFVALIPTLVAGTTLLSIAVIAAEDAYHAHTAVLHAVQLSEAEAAARACAAHAHRHLVTHPLDIRIPTQLTLAGGARCTIESIREADGQYEIQTAARSGSIYRTWEITGTFIP